MYPEASSLRTLKIMPSNRLNEIVHSWIQLLEGGAWKYYTCLPAQAVREFIDPLRELKPA